MMRKKRTRNVKNALEQSSLLMKPREREFVMDVD